MGACRRESEQRSEPTSAGQDPALSDGGSDSGRFRTVLDIASGGAGRRSGRARSRCRITCVERHGVPRRRGEESGGYSRSDRVVELTLAKNPGVFREKARPIRTPRSALGRGGGEKHSAGGLVPHARALRPAAPLPRAASRTDAAGQAARAELTQTSGPTEEDWLPLRQTSSGGVAGVASFRYRVLRSDWDADRVASLADARSLARRRIGHRRRGVRVRGAADRDRTYAGNGP